MAWLVMRDIKIIIKKQGAKYLSKCAYFSNVVEDLYLSNTNTPSMFIPRKNIPFTLAFVKNLKVLFFCCSFAWLLYCILFFQTKLEVCK